MLVYGYGAIVEGYKFVVHLWVKYFNAPKTQYKENMMHIWFLIAPQLKEVISAFAS